SPIGLCWSGSLAGKPVLFEPRALGLEGFAAMTEGAESGTVDRFQVGPPVTLVIGLDVAGPNDGGCPEGGQVDGLVVEGADLTAGTDDELHGQHLLRVADDPAAGPVHQHPVEGGLDTGKGRGD